MNFKQAHWILAVLLTATLATPSAQVPSVQAQQDALSVVGEKKAVGDPAVVWPQFRGPNFNPVGTDTGLPERWSTTENVAWSVEVPGRGWSSPVVVGDRIFLTTVTTDGESKPPQTGTEYSNQYVAELMKQGLSEEEIEKKVMERDFELPDQVYLHYYLACFDLETGQEHWKQEYHAGKPPGGRHRKNSFASETPVTDGQKIYVYSTHLGLFAYDLDGQLVWKKELPVYPIYMEFGTGSSPALVGEQLIIVDDNQEKSTISSYSTKDGSLNWQTARMVPESVPQKMFRSSWATPYIWKNDERTEIVTMGPGAAISYDLQGQELWRLEGMTPAPSSSSFAYQGVLYLNGGRGRPFVAVLPGAKGDITLAEGETESAHVRWIRARAGTYIPTPVAYKNALYVVQDNGIALGLDLESGRINFKERIGSAGKADFTASPWAYNGKIFCASEQGHVYVYEASDEFDLVRVNHLDEMIMASPAIVGDRLLLRTATRLYCIQAQGS